MAARSQAPAPGRKVPAWPHSAAGRLRRGQATASGPLSSLSSGAQLPSQHTAGLEVTLGARPRSSSREVVYGAVYGPETITNNRLRGAHRKEGEFTDFRSIAWPGAALMEVPCAGETPVAALQRPSPCPVAKVVSLVVHRLLTLQRLPQL